MPVSALKNVRDGILYTALPCAGEGGEGGEYK